MTRKPKKTRNCIEPWRSFQFHAGGDIIPCCSGTMIGNFGNIITDYFAAIQNGKHPDLFANKAYIDLRNGLLTGELNKSCIACRSVHEEDITPEELQQRVINHLESQGHSTVGKDLSREYAFYECGGNITNKCNFSCLYCAHSGEKGHVDFFQLEIAQERFLTFLDFICSKGLKIFNFCGIGELTIYPEWQRLCESILNKHPQLKLRIISNFGKKFTESELDTFLRFDIIHVSCDTFDENIYAWLRKGGYLPILLDNIRRLKTKFSDITHNDPKLVFNITVTDAIIDHLEELFRFAAENSMFVHLSSLFVMDGSISSMTNCVKKITDLDDSQMPHLRETLLDLPRRMKAQNPLTNVWEYKFIYKSIKQKADKITFNEFSPNIDEIIYNIFYLAHLKNADAYLRKIWLSFDEDLKGIFITAGKKIQFELPSIRGKLTYRAIWCHERMDGNLEIIKGEIEEITIAEKLSLSFANCPTNYNNILFEVLSFTPSCKAGHTAKEIEPLPPADRSQPVLIREAFLDYEEDTFARLLVESQEPIVIWCAGLRALQLLSNTCLGQANIEMIIDGNPEKKGQHFCGKTICSPNEINSFTGKIIVTHASSPEQVEFQIRRLGVTNEIMIL